MPRVHPLPHSLPLGLRGTLEASWGKKIAPWSGIFDQGKEIEDGIEKTGIEPENITDTEVQDI